MIFLLWEHYTKSIAGCSYSLLRGREVTILLGDIPWGHWQQATTLPRESRLQTACINDVDESPSLSTHESSQPPLPSATSHSLVQRKKTLVLPLLLTLTSTIDCSISPRSRYWNVKHSWAKNKVRVIPRMNRNFKKVSVSTQEYRTPSYFRTVVLVGLANNPLYSSASKHEILRTCSACTDQCQSNAVTSARHIAFHSQRTQEWCPYSSSEHGQHGHFSPEQLEYFARPSKHHSEWLRHSITTWQTDLINFYIPFHY
jgi:hypothetical protein